MGKARFNVSVEDYVAYNQHRCAPGALMGVGIGVAIVVAISSAGGAEPFPIVLASLVAGSIMAVILILIVIPRHARQVFLDHRFLQEERMISIAVDHFEIVQLSGSFRSAWSDVLMWDETPRLLLLYVTRKMMIPITKAEIGEDLTQRLKAYLVHSGLAKPNKRRPRK